MKQLEKVITMQLNIMVKYCDINNLHKFSDQTIRKVSDLRTCSYFITTYIKQYDDEYGVALRHQYETFLEFCIKFCDLFSKFNHYENLDNFVEVTCNPKKYDKDSFVEGIQYLEILKNHLEKYPGTMAPFVELSVFTALTIKNFTERYFISDLKKIVQFLQDQLY